MVLFVTQLIYFLLMANSTLIFDFQKDSDISNWKIVDDVVMGGRSSGSFEINEEGNGRFNGKVSLENNGGFSSLRYLFDQKTIEGATMVKLYVKGDRKVYQFRVKTNASDYYSYIASFETTGNWQIIEIPLSTMYPSFRGQKLNMDNFPAEKMEEIRFLIANKKPQIFELLIDKIILV